MAFAEYVLKEALAPEQIQPGRVIVYGLSLPVDRQREMARFCTTAEVLDAAGRRAAGCMLMFFAGLPEGMEPARHASMARLVRAMMAECPHFLYFAAPVDKALAPLLRCVSALQRAGMLSEAAAYGARLGDGFAAQTRVNRIRRFLYLEADGD